MIFLSVKQKFQCRHPGISRGENLKKTELRTKKKNTVVGLDLYSRMENVSQIFLHRKRKIQLKRPERKSFVTSFSSPDTINCTVPGLFLPTECITIISIFSFPLFDSS